MELGMCDVNGAKYYTLLEKKIHEHGSAAERYYFLAKVI